MKKRKDIISNSTRCIPVEPCEAWPDGLMVLGLCGACDLWKNTCCEKGKTVCLCSPLYAKLLDYPDFAESKIDDLRKIKSNCPLRKYNDMRWHEMSEIPDTPGRVNIEVQAGDTKIIHTGYCVPWQENWVVDGYGINHKWMKGFELLRWKKIL